MFDPAKVVEGLEEQAGDDACHLDGARMRTPQLLSWPILVTEKCQVKHAYQKGVIAQRGIESRMIETLNHLVMEDGLADSRLQSLNGSIA